MTTQLDLTLQPTVQAAAAVLSRHFGTAVTLAEPERLGGTKSRSCVLRCQVVASAGLPATVILKRTLGDATGPEVDAGTADSPLGRLAAEWAGGRLLEGRDGQTSLARGSYGVDADARLIVLEDLGAGSCLADRLQGDDAGLLEEAFVRYAASLGRLHAATIGREAEYLALRAGLGVTAPPEPTRDRAPGQWYLEKVVPLLARVAELGVQAPAGLEQELSGVASAMEAPGPWLAFTPGDTCPDNHHVRADGTLRFFDFEFSGFRHALLDAAYCRVPFPTCWCVNRMPVPLTEAAEAAYRTELIKGCPEAGDEARFNLALAQACAMWSLTTLTFGPEHRFDLAGTLEVDGRWGISTARERHLLRLDTLVTATARLGHLPAIGELAFRLGAVLRDRWPGVEMPYYPPFRGS